MKDDRINLFAKRLVGISMLDDGLLDNDRISCVVQTLKTMFSGRQLQKILRRYLFLIEKYANYTHLAIEHCGDLSMAGIAAIQAHIEKSFNRCFRVVVRRCDDLIAGLRIIVDDVIIEHSIASMLEAYKNSLGFSLQSST